MNPRLMLGRTIQAWSGKTHSSVLLAVLAGSVFLIGCSTGPSPEVESLRAQVAELTERLDALEASPKVSEQSPQSMASITEKKRMEPVLAPQVRGIRRQNLLAFAETRNLSAQEINRLGQLLADEADKIRALVRSVPRGADPTTLMQGLSQIEGEVDGQGGGILGPVHAEAWLAHRRAVRAREDGGASAGHGPQ